MTCKQEPIAYIHKWKPNTAVVGKALHWFPESPHGNSMEIIPLYTTPQQRTWVGLTDAEIDAILIDLMRQHKSGAVTLSRAIEAKCKEKNHD